MGERNDGVDAPNGEFGVLTATTHRPVGSCGAVTVPSGATKKPVSAVFVAPDGMVQDGSPLSAATGWKLAGSPTRLVPAVEETLTVTARVTRASRTLTAGGLAVTEVFR